MTDAFVVEVTEAISPGFMSTAEVERRFRVLLDWRGRPSLSLSDARKVYAECTQRAENDAAVRQAWAIASGEWQQRREQARKAGAAAARIPEGTGDGAATQLRAAAGSRALTQWDAEHPYPGSDAPNADPSEHEWFARTGGRF